MASTEPVRDVADELNEHEAGLARCRGREMIGLPQRTLEGLDEATLGLRGLMLLAAAPNVGKTALGVQLGTDVVRRNEDACFVFVSLEMPRQDIVTRILSRLAGLDWKTLVLGSARRKGGDPAFTPEELGYLDTARERLADIGRRVRILDERNCPEPTTETVLRHLQELKAKTGASRGFLLVDCLQVWPIPPDKARTIRTDLEADKWRVEQMKRLRDGAEDTAVLVISEARKPAETSKDRWGGDLADVMGSARGSYTPDMIFLLRPFDDDELQNVFDPDAVHADKKPNAEDLARWRVTLAKAGEALNKLQVAKGRDGVFKRTLDLIFYWKRSDFKERDPLEDSIQGAFTWIGDETNRR